MFHSCFFPRSCNVVLCAVLCWLPSAAAIGNDPLLERDVLPILTKNCMGCHGGIHAEGELDLRTLPAMISGGESGPAIVPGKSDHSELWLKIESDEMPSGDNEKLSDEDKAVIKNWIDAGLPTVAQSQENSDPLLSPGKAHPPKEVAVAIDQHVDTFLKEADLTAAGRSDDAEFLRRVYLDLSGRIPTAEQARDFLNSEDTDKRVKLIDALLASDEFGEQFGRTWRDWICPPELPSDMNSGKQPHQQARELGKWLGEKFNANESWDKITRDILTVEGKIKEQPQVIFFPLVGEEGKSTPDGSAQAVASLFLGVQLQCARCHDDPYRTWSQQEHWQLAAFFGNSQADFDKVEVGKGPSKKPGEIIIPDSAFRNQGDQVRAAFLGSGAAPKSNDKDLRKPLVDWMTARDNPYFSRALANRAWFYLFSRGIVNPIDDFRELNPPSHPGLIDLLASEFAASGYDVKHLLRCICNSEAYQRTSRPVAELDERENAALATAFGRMPLRVMSADMLFDSLKLAYADEKLDLRGGTAQHNTSGESAAVGDPYLEFQRRFGTNEEDATDFTHGIAQMLTMINHPRLLEGSNGLEEFRKANPAADQKQQIEWLYLSTLSRLPTAEELNDAAEYVEQADEPNKAFHDILWTLVNRSEFILVR